MVHLGMVYTITVNPESLQLGEYLAGSLWLSPKDLSEKITAESVRLETWSTLALRLIGGDELFCLVLAKVPEKELMQVSKWYNPT